MLPRVAWTTLCGLRQPKNSRPDTFAAWKRTAQQHIADVPTLGQLDKLHRSIGPANLIYKRIPHSAIGQTTLRYRRIPHSASLTSYTESLFTLPFRSQYCVECVLKKNILAHYWHWERCRRKWSYPSVLARSITWKMLFVNLLDLFPDWPTCFLFLRGSDLKPNLFSFSVGLRSETQPVFFLYLSAFEGLIRLAQSKEDQILRQFFVFYLFIVSLCF